MQSLTVFGIVGDVQAGLSSTARDSLGYSARSGNLLLQASPNARMLLACSTCSPPKYPVQIHFAPSLLSLGPPAFVAVVASSQALSY
jgi:hypothetical protein